ncbi:MAG: RtcB family protein [Actinomycetota bacterium]
MPPKRLAPKLLSWASDADPQTLEQAERTARLPVVEGHIALMADAHLGLGATIGSVIPTSGSIIPAAVGVDIGCGMIAAQTSLKASDLPDDLAPLLSRIERSVPAGLGKWHRGHAAPKALEWMSKDAHGGLSSAQEKKAAEQLGTLGSGNHFLEIDLDEEDRVWVVLHSGSRGIGNQLADKHIKLAKRLAEESGLPLEDRDLAYFQEKTKPFDEYVRDMQWAQRYALENREIMMSATLHELFAFVGTGEETDRVNCHHNFAQKERHGEREVWVTRKGAIRAGTGDLGVIPGSMGAKSYIVRGKGEPQSYSSSAHGAGRRMSRTQAKKQFTVEDLERVMGDRVWLKGRARSLLDEIPGAYKDIDAVMSDQADLVEVVHELRGILNYKGT